MPRQKLSSPLVERLTWIHAQLLASRAGGSRLSSATKGRERENFLDLFLRNCVPPQFRFGSGDIVDHRGVKSGQVDVVIEIPFYPSLPLVGGTRERLYLVEGVSAVVEVKSDFTKQWQEVLDTARAVDVLERAPGGATVDNSPYQLGAPAILAVGFEGWHRPDTLLSKMKVAKHLDGALQLNPLKYVQRLTGDDGKESFFLFKGPNALGMFLLHLSTHLRSVVSDWSNMALYFSEGAG
jgi:hypothetical protein